MPNAKQLLYQTEKKQPSEVFYEKAVLKNFLQYFWENTYFEENHVELLLN